MRKSGLASLAVFYYDFREDEKKDLRGLSEVAQFLVKQGANASARDQAGRTPLHWASLKAVIWKSHSSSSTAPMQQPMLHRRSRHPQ